MSVQEERRRDVAVGGNFPGRCSVCKSRTDVVELVRERDLACAWACMGHLGLEVFRLTRDGGTVRCRRVEQ